MQAQISILCPQPYFKSIDELVKEFSSTESLFEFPFAIEKPGIEFSRMTILAKENIINQGDAETGVVIELFSQGTVINPVIYNLTTRETLKLKVTMQTADLIRINTISGEKSVVLQRDGINSKYSQCPGQNKSLDTCTEWRQCFHI
ncbi:phage tail domain-containing protein [Robinsoniella sp. KNHs210]|uniref:phage tail domain-containing protein n=1 Tax=Robinsoniella sp. KNHs210 TaxID=1469950 RepID=UPI000485D241|nr:phage tail domain-containing protein [Robinsoniella sp. KNHs210]